MYNGARAANAPVRCDGCHAPFCPNCAFDTMLAFKDATQRRGTTQRQVNEAALRRTDRSERRVEIVVSECRYCTRNADLAEPDHANLLDYALLKLGVSFADLHAEYLRVTDTEHALASSFEQATSPPPVSSSSSAPSSTAPAPSSTAPASPTADTTPAAPPISARPSPTKRRHASAVTDDGARKRAADEHAPDGYARGHAGGHVA